MTEIRKEKPEDVTVIRQVLEQAFDGTQEADIVEMLRTANKAPVAMVALYEGQVVGHIMFSPVSIASVQGKG